MIAVLAGSQPITANASVAMRTHAARILIPTIDPVPVPFPKESLDALSSRRKLGRIFGNVENRLNQGAPVGRS